MDKQADLELHLWCNGYYAEDWVPPVSPD